jgi:hypothetical protein
MNPCGGGIGTSTFDIAAALDQWVTTGKVPVSIPASRTRDGVVDHTRPLCPIRSRPPTRGRAASTTGRFSAPPFAKTFPTLGTVLDGNTCGG